MEFQMNISQGTGFVPERRERGRESRLIQQEKTLQTSLPTMTVKFWLVYQGRGLYIPHWLLKL